MEVNFDNITWDIAERLKQCPESFFASLTEAQRQTCFKIARVTLLGEEQWTTSKQEEVELKTEIPKLRQLADSHSISKRVWNTYILSESPGAALYQQFRKPQYHKPGSSFPFPPEVTAKIAGEVLEPSNFHVLQKYCRGHEQVFWAGFARRVYVMEGVGVKNPKKVLHRFFQAFFGHFHLEWDALPNTLSTIEKLQTLKFEIIKKIWRESMDQLPPDHHGREIAKMFMDQHNEQKLDDQNLLEEFLKWYPVMGGKIPLFKLSFVDQSVLGRLFACKSKKVVLRHNGLAVFPQRLFDPYLARNEEIDISYNFIRSFPESFQDYRGVRSLTLSFNELEEVPPSLSTFPVLTSLNLSHNCLTTIPDSSLPESLESLDLSHNGLRLFPYLGRLSKLGTLNLASNSLATAPRSLTYLPSLTSLNIAGNPISDQSLTELVTSTVKIIREESDGS